MESFDRHMAVNARATWLLVREFAARFRGPAGTGRIVALTSDHTAGNLPYGASKGALDRIVLAAAVELAELRVSANVVNPGPTDTGWLTPDLHARLAERTPLGRVGTAGRRCGARRLPVLARRRLGQRPAAAQRRGHQRGLTGCGGAWYKRYGPFRYVDHS